ncbi:DUF3953 domain-containing protein [Cytobacillus dafuensis]|uniref:DUF3953 domain-containing protein n=1 Tax=Cytobacillus dafuensis TaxID=1742359 RepID=A0A5B8Z3U2_CYTDA|nr:DUF3953 domain-containing protein [Cytobacillus dafuensis]QED46279.1 DUF3953 domain-containing protein [Cytobacillus dafuensis]
MLKILRIIFSLSTVALSAFSLITQNYNLTPYVMFLLGVTMLMTGIIELQKDKKGFPGYLCIIVSLFIFFVSIQGFLVK